MARRFNGSSDAMKFNPGGCSAGGAITLAFLVRRGNRAAGHWDALISMLQGTSDASADNCTVEISASDYFTGDEISIETSAGFTHVSPSIRPSNTTDFFTIALSKASGNDLPRAHVRNFSTAGAWAHADGPLLVGNGTATDPSWEIRIGKFQATDFLNGDALVGAWWNAELSDAQIEAALTGNYNDWKAGTGGGGAPASIWPIGDAARLGSAANAVPDDTGTATWKSTAGTTFVSDPAGWSWGGIPTLSDELTKLRGNQRQAVKRSALFCLGEKWARRRSGLLVPSSDRPLLAGA